MYWRPIGLADAAAILSGLATNPRLARTVEVLSSLWSTQVVVIERGLPDEVAGRLLQSLRSPLAGDGVHGGGGVGTPVP